MGELGYMTVIIGHTTFCFPFVLVGVQARLQGIDPFLEEAAMDLGATPIQAFWKVIVPYLMPAIIAGALMSFTLSFDEYIVTVFTVSAGSRALPLQVYGMARKGPRSSAQRAGRPLRSRHHHSRALQRAHQETHLKVS